MNIKEINALRVGEDFDELVARHVMGWEESAIENINIPFPEYSLDRGCAINVIDAICFMPEETREKFDLHIEQYIEEIKKRIGTCRPSDFLRFLTPDEICRAALKATLI